MCTPVHAAHTIDDSHAAISPLADPRPEGHLTRMRKRALEEELASMHQTARTDRERTKGIQPLSPRPLQKDLYLRFDCITTR